MTLQKILNWITPFGLVKQKPIPIINEEDENISMLHPRGTTITLFTYTVPQKSKMVLTYFANYLSLTTHWTYITWSIRRNGVGVYPYDTIQDQVGLQDNPRRIKRINFNGGDMLSILATDDNTLGQPPNLYTGIAIRFETIGK